MSKRSQIQEHLQKLDEIGDIMRAMKNVSLMELHKLARFIDHQQRVLAGIEQATQDFVCHYASVLPAARTVAPTRVVALGSERGFCGDYNDAVADTVQRVTQDGRLSVVAVGSRLQQRLDGAGRSFHRVTGASTVDEVQSVLELVMRALVGGDPLGDRAPLVVSVVCHQDGQEGVQVRTVSALPAPAAGRRREPYPPRLNVPAPALHHQLMRHYLWAQMHQLFYSALLAEHRARLQHMESALQRMEEKTAALRRRQNILRQEEITEEIEVIMLNSDVQRKRRGAQENRSWQ